VHISASFWFEGSEASLHHTGPDRFPQGGSFRLGGCPSNRKEAPIRRRSIRLILTASFTALFLLELIGVALASIKTINDAQGDSKMRPISGR
jgi:hypothetical protein